MRATLRVVGNVLWLVPPVNEDTARRWADRWAWCGDAWVVVTVLLTLAAVVLMALDVWFGPYVYAVQAGLLLGPFLVRAIWGICPLFLGTLYYRGLLPAAHSPWFASLALVSHRRAVTALAGTTVALVGLATALGLVVAHLAANAPGGIAILFLCIVVASLPAGRVIGRWRSKRLAEALELPRDLPRDSSRGDADAENVHLGLVSELVAGPLRPQ